MNLKFKFDSKVNKKMDFESVVNFAGRLWRKSRTFLFFLFLAASIFGGGFIWQQSLSGSGWSQQRKQEFMDSQNKNVEFNQKPYQKIIEQIEIRSSVIAEEYRSVKDVFATY